MDGEDITGKRARCRWCWHSHGDKEAARFFVEEEEMQETYVKGTVKVNGGGGCFQPLEFLIVI